MENLKKSATEDDKKRQEDLKQAEVYESHSKFMKSKVSLEWRPVSKTIFTCSLHCETLIGFIVYHLLGPIHVSPLSLSINLDLLR